MFNEKSIAHSIESDEDRDRILQVQKELIGFIDSTLIDPSVNVHECQWRSDILYVEWQSEGCWYRIEKSNNDDNYAIIIHQDSGWRQYDFDAGRPQVWTNEDRDSNRDAKDVGLEEICSVLALLQRELPAAN